MHSDSRPSGWRSSSVRVAAGVAVLAVLSCGLLVADPATPPASQPSGALPQTTRPAPGPSGIMPSTNPSDLTLYGGGALPLDPRPFDRLAAGISFRSPLGWNGIVQADRDELIHYTNNLKKQDWTFTVSRRSFAKPQHLFATKDPKDPKGDMIPGIVENTLAALQKELPGAKVLRAGDPSNIGSSDVGMIVIRYTKNGERRLAQHAIVQANDQLYFLLAFNSPARKDVAEDNNPEEKTVDPLEQREVETFRNILDTVKLLDLRPVRQDQVERLFHTRALIGQINEKRINKTIVKDRFLRVIKDGKDIGYSYVNEIPDRRGGTDGVSILIDTRVMTLKDGKVQPFPRQDTETHMFCAMDRRNESWSMISAWDEDGKPKTALNPWKQVSEIGTSARSIRNVIVADPNDPTHPENRVRRGDNIDPTNPWVDQQVKYSLNVQFKATRGDLEPVVRQLPPFYLPQALGSMLPRLLPAKEPKAYLFATYVSDLRQVALRYVDVRPEEDLPREIVFATGLSRGIPIDDRIGYEGGITTHYVTAEGDYLGSVTKASHLIVVPTDEQALLTRWGVTKKSELFQLPASIEPTVTPAEPPPAGGSGGALINEVTPRGGLRR